MHLTSFAQVNASLSELAAQPPPDAEKAALVGAALAHCAQSIEYSLTGFPQPRGWVVRKLIGPLVLRKFLRQGHMRHDVLAGIPGAPNVPMTTTSADGLARLRQAMTAFEAHTGPLAPHFAYGEVSKADYEAVHAMHVADHLTSLTGR